MERTCNMRVGFGVCGPRGVCVLLWIFFFLIIFLAIFGEIWRFLGINFAENSKNSIFYR